MCCVGVVLLCALLTLHLAYPQVQFATPAIMAKFVEAKGPAMMRKIGASLHKALATNRLGVEDMFEDYACTVLSHCGIQDSDVLFMTKNDGLGRLVRREPARARRAEVVYFVSKQDLQQKVQRLGFGNGFFIPVSRVQGVIDAFGWVRFCSKGSRRLRLVGFQVTRSMRHPISSSQLPQVNELARIIKSAPRLVRAGLGIVSRVLG